MNWTLALLLYEEASARHETWGLRLLSWADIVTWADTWVLACPRFLTISSLSV